MEIYRNMPYYKKRFYFSKFYSKVLGVEAEGDDVHVELKTIFSAEGMENMVLNSMQGADYGGFTILFKVDDVDL